MVKPYPIQGKLTNRKIGTVLLTTLLLSLGLQLIASLINHFFPMPPEYLEHYKKTAMIHSGYDLIKIVTTMALIPAIVEELIFRGLLFNFLSKIASPAITWLLITILFAAAHFNPWLFPFYLILGGYFTYLRWQENSVILPILAHLTNNLLAILIINI